MLDRAALDAWNIAGGLDWAAMPILAELQGVDDIEGWIRRLVALRDILAKVK